MPQSYWSMGWKRPTVAGALAAIAVGCGVGLAAMWATRQEHDGVEPGVEAEHGIEDGADRGADLAGADEVSAPPAPGPSIVVTVVMLTAWAAAASMSALSVSQQRIGFDPQTPWRDGIFGFLAIATLLWALIEHTSRSGSGQALRAAVAAVALLAGVQFALNTGTIAQTRSISPNMLYGRIDDLFASPPDEDQTCDLANDLYDLAQQPGQRYYTTALLESLKRLRPLEECPAPRSLTFRPSGSFVSAITAKRYPPQTSSLVDSSAAVVLDLISARSLRSKSPPSVPSAISRATRFHASHISTLSRISRPGFFIHQTSDPG